MDGACGRTWQPEQAFDFRLPDLPLQVVSIVGTRDGLHAKKATEEVLGHGVERRRGIGQSSSCTTHPWIHVSMFKCLVHRTLL